MSNLGGLFLELVEVEVKEQHIDARLTKHAKLTGRYVCIQKLANRCFGKAAGFGDARYLEVCCVGCNVRVKARARGGDEIDWNRLRGILFGERVDGTLNSIDERLVGLG